MRKLRVILVIRIMKQWELTPTTEVQMRTSLCALIVVLIMLAAPWAALAPAAAVPTTAVATVVGEIAPPAGFSRSPTNPGSFKRYLRGLRLLPEGKKVLAFDGTPISVQYGHARVVSFPVLGRHQECADTIMALRARWLLEAGRRSEIEFSVGRGETYRFRGGDLDRYLKRLYVLAGTHTLSAAMGRMQDGEALSAGDVLVWGGSPGHAVIVLDVATTQRGERRVMLGQGFMPAQQLHVLRTPASVHGKPDPWFDAADLGKTYGLHTLSTKPFRLPDVRIW